MKSHVCVELSSDSQKFGDSPEEFLPNVLASIISWCQVKFEDLSFLPAEKFQQRGNPLAPNRFGWIASIYDVAQGRCNVHLRKLIYSAEKTAHDVAGTAQ